MPLSIFPIDANFSVSTQLMPEDVPKVADMGYQSIIINRPDFEGGENQPTASAILKAGESAKLRVEYQPVKAGVIAVADVIHFSKLLEVLPRPVLACCRTGTRCFSLYKSARGGILAERTGLEPATPGVTGRYSNQLNYHSK